LVRASGSFDLKTKGGRVEGISHRFCSPIHRSDGYSYGWTDTIPLQPERKGHSSPASKTGESWPD
jgi:hypothetical protein